MEILNWRILAKLGLQTSALLVILIGNDALVANSIKVYIWFAMDWIFVLPPNPYAETLTPVCGHI